MELSRETAVQEQYRTAGNLNTRISIHQKYSVNRQGFGSWIASHYPVRDGMAALELGCGTGSMWLGQESLIRRFGSLLLSDLSEGMLAQARETLGRQEGVSFRVIDIQDIPCADRSFDLVIANMMLYHVPDLPRALGEVRRVLKPDGAFCCATFGENGMMAYLCALFAEYGVRDSSPRAFTLQNGPSLLAPFFADVRRYDYPDALEVTDPGDLADYIESLAGMSALRALPRETLLAVLRKNMTGGVLRVPKEYGLLIARQPVRAEAD